MHQTTVKAVGFLYLFDGVAIRIKFLGLLGSFFLRFVAHEQDRQSGLLLVDGCHQIRGLPLELLLLDAGLAAAAPL